MKKSFVAFVVLLFAAVVAPAYEVVNLTGKNVNYQFNIYKKGEDLGAKIEGKPVIGFFDILDNYRLPLFKAGESWASVVQSDSLGLKPTVTYSIISENDYNAAAESNYTTVAGSLYKVTYVNAKINGLTPTGGPDEDFLTDGIILLGLGTDPDYPGWAVSMWPITARISVLTVFP